LLKRAKRRYLALEIDSDEPFGQKEFMDAVWISILKLYGEHGASRASLSLISCDPERGIAVIRVAHAAVEMIRAALASMIKVGNKPVSVRVIKISGTIESLREKTKP
jgi:RNase P/RNase MRP subunit POP5